MLFTHYKHVKKSFTILLVCALLLTIGAFYAYRCVCIDAYYLRQFYRWVIPHLLKEADFKEKYLLLPSFSLPIKKFSEHMVDSTWCPSYTATGVINQQAESLEDSGQRLSPRKRSIANNRRRRARARLDKAAFKRYYMLYGMKGMFSWPIEQSQFWLSSRYGPRRKEDGSWGFHYGIDLAAIKGTLVSAASDGRVIEAGNSVKGYGKTVVIEYGDYQTRYAHLQKIMVSVGQQITKGECIGKVGDTGYVRGENGSKNASHLHFEVKYKGKYTDPISVLT